MLTLNIPALLFPAISFLLLPYTNRYLALSSLVRGLLREWEETRNPRLLQQIAVLRRRINIIRLMQTAAVAAMLLSILSMVAIYAIWAGWEGPLFVAALSAMVLSLILSLYEIQLSTEALNVQLSSMHDENPRLGTGR